MATIEERADRFALQIDFNIHKNEGTTEVEQSIRAQGVQRGYIQGATEQYKIDIENACNWLSSNYGDQIDTNEFRQVMGRISYDTRY